MPNNTNNKNEIFSNINNSLKDIHWDDFQNDVNKSQNDPHMASNFVTAFRDLSHYQEYRALTNTPVTKALTKLHLIYQDQAGIMEYDNYYRAIYKLTNLGNIYVTYLQYGKDKAPQPKKTTTKTNKQETSQNDDQQANTTSQQSNSTNDTSKKSLTVPLICCISSCIFSLITFFAVVFSESVPLLLTECTILIISILVCFFSAVIMSRYAKYNNGTLPKPSDSDLSDSDDSDSDWLDSDSDDSDEIDSDVLNGIYRQLNQQLKYFDDNYQSYDTKKQFVNFLMRHHAYVHYPQTDYNYLFTAINNEMFNQNSNSDDPFALYSDDSDYMGSDSDYLHPFESDYSDSDSDWLSDSDSDWDSDSDLDDSDSDLDSDDSDGYLSDSDSDSDMFSDSDSDDMPPIPPFFF